MVSSCTRASRPKYTHTYNRDVDTLTSHVQPELAGFVLTLALSLLIGFEREELRDGRPRSFFGGVRTFPLIGLAAFLLRIGFPGSALPYSVGLVVLGGLLILSHFTSLKTTHMGITSEMAAILTWGVGGVAAGGQYWLAVAGGVVAVLLLHEKERLEGLVDRIPRGELGTLVRFLLLTGVILPVVPDHSFTALQVNPYKIWLVVVAVSGISYLSYLLQLRWGRAGLLLAGLLGGAYSSTATTVVLSRQSRDSARRPVRFAGAILAATGVMYLRLWILIFIFARPLASHLDLLFWSLGLSAVVLGSVLAHSRRAEKPDQDATDEVRRTSGNPLELTSAFTFGLIFVAVLVLTRWVAGQFGRSGVLLLAAIMGTTDVDPFILGIAQSAGGATLPLGTAALAVVIAAAANNVMKGCYSLFFGDPAVGRLSLALLALWGAASLACFLLL